MENLQLILVTVLITLVSVAVVGSIAYLVAVVRKLRRVVKNNEVDITDLQNALNVEVKRESFDSLFFYIPSISNASFLPTYFLKGSAKFGSFNKD